MSKGKGWLESKGEAVLWDNYAKPASHCSERGGPSWLLEEVKGRWV